MHEEDARGICRIVLPDDQLELLRDFKIIWHFRILISRIGNLDLH